MGNEFSVRSCQVNLFRQWTRLGCSMFRTASIKLHYANTTTDERTNTHNMLPHPNISTCQDVKMWQNVRPLAANCSTTNWQHVVRVRPWVMLCASVRVVEFDT